jgi:alkyl hydroperoxide reductase subunit AhpC
MKSVVIIIGLAAVHLARYRGVARNVDEVVRVLDALQTGGLTACNWKRGQAALSLR